MENIKYAGFWQRAAALLIDLVIMSPLLFLILWAYMNSISLYAVIIIPSTILSWVYYGYFLKRWGATIGKMVLKIKVTGLDCEALSYKQIFYRYVVYFGLHALSLACFLYLYKHLDVTLFDSLDVKAKAEYIKTNAPSIETWINWAMNLWFWSEVLVLIFNKKKRAIHDFMAGTIVICKNN
jgi:uncharacterized RDD family membrane protein YckC